MTRAFHRCAAGFVFVLCPSVAAAQAPEPSPAAPAKGSFKDWLVARLNVQQVIKDKNSVDKPAYLQLTYPRDGPTQKDTSVSIVLDALAATETFKAGFTTEFVEKTGIDKPQNNLAAGLGAIWVGHIGHVDIGSVVRPPALNPLVEAELKYKKDGVLTTKGLSGAVRFTMLTHPKVFRWGPYDTHTLVGSWRFKWEPRIGIEYDNVISAKQPTDPEGTYVRSYYEIAVYVYPFGKLVDNRLVLSWDYAYRDDLATPSTVIEQSHNFRTYSALVYIDGGRRFGIGVDRVSGQDPSQGFKEQALTRVSFKLRIKAP